MLVFSHSRPMKKLVQPNFLFFFVVIVGPTDSYVHCCNLCPYTWNQASEWFLRKASVAKLAFGGWVCRAARSTSEEISRSDLSYRHITPACDNRCRGLKSAARPTNSINASREALNKTEMSETIDCAECFSFSFFFFHDASARWWPGIDFMNGRGEKHCEHNWMKNNWLLTFGEGWWKQLSLQTGGSLENRTNANPWKRKNASP